MPIPASTSREIVEFIVQNLARGRSREDVTKELSERFELNYRQAEGMVLRAESVYEREIEMRRSPALLAFSALALVGGVVLIVIALVEIGSPLIAVLFGGQAWKDASALASTAFYEDVPQLIIGAGLVIAGVRGLRNTLWIIRKKA